MKSTCTPSGRTQIQLIFVVITPSREKTRKDFTGCFPEGISNRRTSGKPTRIWAQVSRRNVVWHGKSWNMVASNTRKV